MFTVETYIDALKTTLENNSEQLIQKLKQVRAYNYFKEIDLLDIIITIQYFKEIEIIDFLTEVPPFTLSITLYSMDNDTNEVIYEGDNINIFGGSQELLRETEYYYLKHNHYNSFEEAYNATGEQLDAIQEQVLVEWFSRCWDNAEGKDISLPIYVSFHENENSYDLHQNKWVSFNEKWKRKQVG